MSKRKPKTRKPKLPNHILAACSSVIDISDLGGVCELKVTHDRSGGKYDTIRFREIVTERDADGNAIASVIELVPDAI